MQLHEGLLYIEFADFIAAGWKEDTIKKANLRNGANWQMIANPKDKRKPLVQFDTLIDEHKNKLQLRFGNVYEYVVKQPIKSLLKVDAQAQTFFTGYRFGENNKSALAPKKVKQYIRAAQWLTMLNEAASNKKIIKKELGINIPTLYKHVGELMEIEKKNGSIKEYEGNEQLAGDFGTSYDRIIRKQKAFKEEGYSLLIDKMYGNQLASKVSDELAEAKLLSLLNDNQQQDDVMVCMLYNMWAHASGYKTITPATVGARKRSNEFYLTTGREGNSAFNEKFIRQVKGMRPSTPLMFVEHDDNNLDFLFQDKEGYAFNRYVSVVVTDSYCDLVLGKSYIQSSSPIQEQVYHAYLDAMYYIRSLTGGWYMPFEIKSDKGAGSTLIPFYKKMGNYIPAGHGNKHRGYIEQFFGSPHWKRSQKLVSEGNWNGNNMTAKYRGVNEDELRLNAKNRPMIGEEAETQIETFFHALRHMPAFTRENMNAPSKEAQWLEAWNKLTIEQKQPITDEQFLLIFGIKHQPQGRTITITNRGIEPQICNTKYSYDLPEQWMYSDLIGEDVSVYFDPFDMSRVLVTNEKDIRFIATTAQLSPRALEDTYTGSRTYLNAVLTNKKEQVNKVTKKVQKLKELVPANYEAQALLQGGMLVKGIKNQAEQKAIEQSLSDQEKYLDENYDFNTFFNQNSNND